MQHETKTYAKFRRELLALCPYMGEREIYRNWWRYNTHSRPGDDWTLQQTPMRGVDSKYHYLYVTTPDSTGEIYVGIHSTLELDDGYSGSGDEVRKCKDCGVKLDTTVLEFFRTREEALAMERYVVNAKFLVESGVLNKTIGGDDSRHVVGGSMLVESGLQKGIPIKQVSVEMPFGESVEVPVMGGSTIRSEPTKVPKSSLRRRYSTPASIGCFPLATSPLTRGTRSSWMERASRRLGTTPLESRLRTGTPATPSTAMCSTRLLAWRGSGWCVAI